ncbi:MAG: ABC transporter ATP-binding protein, partial [Halobacteriales archaeon]|nr:ABC transporter ATP-binding protein [Halobacteriales archaeon]
MNTGDGGPVIEVEGLTKYYGDVRGAEDVSFTVDAGEVFGFLGPNGAGKSTTIRMLLGFINPTAGGARLLDHDVTDRDALLEAKEHIGYVSGESAFYEHVTGERLLDYFGRIKGQDRREELLERFPIPEGRPVKEYSRGNRQKLAIVQAFMNRPDLLIMDEPTSGL